MSNYLRTDAEKSELRAQISKQLREIGQDVRIVLDAHIASHITQLTVWKNADIVLGYVAMADEVDVSAVLRSAVRTGKTVALPRIEPENPERPMEFRVVATPEDSLQDEGKTIRSEAAWDAIVESLPTHPYGFQQPSKSHALLTAFDVKTLVLVPGRAFDRKGNRLGRGKGYYDGFLGGLVSSVATVGVCYDAQIRMTVPTDDDDVPVSTIVTDAETCFCRR